MVVLTEQIEIPVSWGVFFQLTTHPDSGSFHAVPRHFSLKYVIFRTFQTAELEEKSRQSAKTQLCSVALSY